MGLQKSHVTAKVREAFCNLECLSLDVRWKWSETAADML